MANTVSAGRQGGPAGPATAAKTTKTTENRGKIMSDNGLDLKVRKLSGMRGKAQVIEAVRLAAKVVRLSGPITKANIKRQIKLTFGGTIAGAGNSKVGADTITFNISTTYEPKGKAFTCPEAIKGTCQILQAIQAESGAPVGQSVADSGQAIAHQLVNRCYAASDNRQYTDTRKRDVRSQKAFRDNDLSPEHLAAWLVLSWYVDAQPADMRKDFGDSDLRLRWARFNVRGGARSVADFKRMESIGFWLVNAFGIRAYTYTSRYDIWADVAKAIHPEYLTVTGSNFMAHNNFKVFATEADIPAGMPKCPGSCANCHICKVPHLVTAGIAQH